MFCGCALCLPWSTVVSLISLSRTSLSSLSKASLVGAKSVKCPGSASWPWRPDLKATVYKRHHKQNVFQDHSLKSYAPAEDFFFFKSLESFQRVFIIFVYKNTGMITHTFSEARSSLDSITSLIVWLTTLMTRSMTCTTPLVAIWLP